MSLLKQIIELSMLNYETDYGLFDRSLAIVGAIIAYKQRKKEN
jgi:hypothetical protein